MRRALFLFALALGLTSTGTGWARDIDAPALARHIAYLADDRLEGRYPGSEGDRLATAYIAEQMAAAGLQPAGSDGWFAPVSIVRRHAQSAALTLHRNGRPVPVLKPDMVVMGRTAEQDFAAMPILLAHLPSISGRPLPDLSGHMVLLLDAERPTVTGMAAIAQAREIRRHFVEAGAAALFIVTERPPGFADLYKALGTSMTELAGKDGMAPVEGAIAKSSAVAMVAASGLDWDRLIAQVRTGNKVGRLLPLRAQLSVRTGVERIESRNVLGRIAGRKPDAGAVLMLAHWDHLGHCTGHHAAANGKPVEDKPVAEKPATDTVCNGALDNASGIAALIEAGRQIGKKRLDRDVYFLATTAEELGLLGIEQFIARPPVPLASIVAAFNLDTLGIGPAGQDVAVIGRGRTPLDPMVAKVLRKRNVRIARGDYADQFVDRQDGWMLLLSGVPALMINSGFADPERVDAFLVSDYHGPGDAYRPGMDLGGVVADARLHVDLVRAFADSQKYRGAGTGVVHGE